VFIRAGTLAFLGRLLSPTTSEAQWEGNRLLNGSFKLTLPHSKHLALHMFLQTADNSQEELESVSEFCLRSRIELDRGPRGRHEMPQQIIVEVIGSTCWPSSNRA
jgi:hypothetical protein